MVRVVGVDVGASALGASCAELPPSEMPGTPGFTHVRHLSCSPGCRG